MIWGYDEFYDINNELKMLIFYFLFIDDVGDFDLEVNYGISNSDFVLFNFVILGFFFEKCWDVFIVCFWFKVFMDISVV